MAGFPELVTLTLDWVILHTIVHQSSTPTYMPNHRLRGSTSPVLTATGFVNGKGRFSTPHRIDTPQPITKEFVTGDYVGDP